MAMNTFKVGDKVRLSKRAYGSLRQHQAIWTVQVVLGDYALIEHPALGRWRSRMEFLRLHEESGLGVAA